MAEKLPELRQELGRKLGHFINVFVYPAEVRKIIYTTNIIEGLNRQFRKITKNKPSFTNDDSLQKIL
ncbi:MAG: transposase [Oscillospiraceae bacterium]|nr:transposase [Oscillospiraceae bacterium]